MAWAYLPESEGSSLDCTSLTGSTERPVLLKKTNTPSECFHYDSPMFRFGMMSPHSIPTPGKEELTSLQRGFPVSHSPPPLEGGTEESQCGPTFEEWSLAFFPDSCSWKMYPVPPGTKWKRDSKTRDSLCRLVCFARQSPELRIEEKGNSSWLPTPTATANQWAPSMRKHPSCRNLQGLVGKSPEVFEWLMGFPPGWTDIGFGPAEMP